MSFYSVIVLFTILILYKFSVNFFSYRRLEKYNKLYDDYFKNECKEEWFIKLLEKKAEIIKLFQCAGLRSYQITMTQPTGYGFFNHDQVDIFDNLTCPLKIGDTSIPSRIQNCFYEGIGIYKTRMKETFSIVYWFNVIIFLPQKIISYLGLPFTDNKIDLISKTLNCIYWFVVILITIILPCFHFALVLKKF